MHELEQALQADTFQAMFREGDDGSESESCSSFGAKGTDSLLTGIELLEVIPFREEKVSCPTASNSGFPQGTRVLSEKNCACFPGHEPATPSGMPLNCSRCQVGFFKDAFGNEKCTACPFSGEVSKTTHGLGSISLAACRCPKRFWGTDFCQKCPAGHYCIGGNFSEDCPTTMTTADNDQAGAATDCVCKPGLMPSEDKSIPECSSCPAGRFKTKAGNFSCNETCPDGQVPNDSWELQLQ